jgi:hypothetical protein
LGKRNPLKGQRIRANLQSEISTTVVDPDQIGSEFKWFPGTGSRRANMTHKNRKKLINFIFEVPDVLF